MRRFSSHMSCALTEQHFFIFFVQRSTLLKIDLLSVPPVLACSILRWGWRSVQNIA